MFLKLLSYSFFVIALLTGSANANQVTAKVAYVIDGDTVIFYDDNNKKNSVRLAEIDAPEKLQRYGFESKEFLSKMINKKIVTIQYDKKDRYGRIIGKIYIDGNYVNQKMVSSGYAWHYKRYSNSKELSHLEDVAKNLKLGLWHDENPMPPWEFRRK